MVELETRNCAAGDSRGDKTEPRFDRQHEAWASRMESGVQQGLFECELFHKHMQRVESCGGEGGVTDIADDGERVVSEILFACGLIEEMLSQADNPEPPMRVRLLFKGRLGLGF